MRELRQSSLSPPRRVSQFRQTVAALVACLLGGAGCVDSKAPQRFPMSGNVTFDGVPIQTGAITFVPLDLHAPSSGGKIENGRFDIEKSKGVVAGRYRVEIVAQRESGRMIEPGPPYPPGHKISEIQQFIPDQYNRHSQLEVDVQPGDTTHNFQLTGKSRVALQ